MTYRLKNRNEIPNGGWQFFQPETLWQAPFNLSDPFEVAVRKIMYHRAGNARFNLPTDYDTVANEFEAFMCKVLIGRGLGERYVEGFEKKTSPPPQGQRTSTLQRVRGAVAVLAAAVKKDAVGAASLSEWIGDGSIPVSQERADERASICLTCPQNQAKRDRFKETVAAAIQSYTKVKNQLGLRAAGEEGLKTCAACDCPLKLKVWVPLKYIVAHTNPGIFPDNCWVPKELKNPPHEPPSHTEPIVTIQRWGAFGDVITATALASRIKAQGFKVRFATHTAMMAALQNHPDIDEMVEHGTVAPDINLDGAHETHPQRRKRSMLSIFDETARKQIKDPDLILGTNGHFRPSLVVTDEEKKGYVDLFSKFKAPWIVIVPKSGQWVNRSIPDQTWKDTAALVNGTCFWTGYDRIEGSTIIDLGTQEFRKVMAAIACADLVVTVDTGPMHVAAALKKPILAIQQSFDLKLRLFPENDWTVFEPPLTCLRCGEYTCPIDKETPPCTRIDARKLAEAINQRLTPIQITGTRMLMGSQVKTIFDGYTKGRIARAVKPADYITVVLRVHNRHQYVSNALKSILAAGFIRVVIAASGITPELNDWLGEQETAGHRVIRGEGVPNSDQWIEGIKAVSTPFAILFNDVDLMLKSYAEALLPLIVGDADFSVCNVTGSDKDFLMNTGVRNSRVVHDELLRHPIHPARGCFPTEKLLASLLDWRDRYGSDIRFNGGGNFQTGNDLFLWLKAVSTLDRCLVISSPYLTIKSDAEPGQFDDLHQVIKDEVPCRPLKYAGLCYVHDWNEASGMLRNLSRAPPGADILWFSDSPDPAPVPSVRIPKIGPFPPGTNVKYVSANVAFIYGLRVIRDRALDWFMWLEYDCRFRGERWMNQLWQENLSWKWNHVCSGSPVIWNLPGYGTKLATAWLPYFGRYAGVTGRFPAFEGWGGGLPSAYPNGAISWYHTETMLDWFSVPLSMNHPGIEKWSRDNTTFDLYIGQQLIKRYGTVAAMKMGWLESSYSGCGEHYYNAESRRKLLADEVIAMHQEKDNAR